MARFSLKDLFVATTLVAIGIVLFCVAAENKASNEVVMFSFFASGAFVFAGIAKPFGHPWIGGGLGLLFMCTLFVLLTNRMISL